MSPPKVNLATKQPLQNVDLSDEGTQEKSDPLAMPVVVAVDTLPRVTPNYQSEQWRRQRARRMVVGVAMIIIVTVAALGTMALVHKLRRHHRRHWTCSGPRDYRMPEHVSVDHANRLITVKHDHDDNLKTNAMEILHEYNRQMVAYKDVDKKVCYIDRLDETFETGYERWESYEKSKRPDRTLRVISQPIEVDVVKHVMDIHITEHCSDSKSMWVMEIEETQVTADMEIVRV